MTAQAGSATLGLVETDRRALRRRVRAARRSLPPAERATADRAITRHILALAEFRAARRISVFLAFDGEPDLTGLVAAASSRGKRLFAPIITRTRMRFAEVTPAARLSSNFFGILEPKLGERIDPRCLDLVLTPLVAVDDAGVRIGVGRGYYDRCFAFLRHRAIWRRPKLLGVAYELQRVGQLEPAPWDVPLWGLATEGGVRRFPGAAP